MANKKYTMVLSSDESRDMLKLLQKSLRNTKTMIEEASSNLTKAKLNTALDDETNTKRINSFEKELDEIKVRYSVKLRFVQHLEEKIEEDDAYTTTEIKIIENDVVN